MPKATRLAPSLVALLLGCSALGSTAYAGWFSPDSKPAATTGDKAANTALPAASLDDSIRQAQMLRLAGNYAEAINHLSQLMLVAADDPRIISEYGKTLVSMGRAEEAEQFLTRAQQLQPDDWTIYSGLGVAYDQIGNQKDAQVNYERALALKPGEPSVLNNYALSRMLAKDPTMARKLADRAEIANAAAPDSEIARNIAMIRSVAPEASNGVAVNTPGPSPVPLAAPHVAVAAAPLAPAPLIPPMPPAARPAPASTVPSTPPRQAANNSVIQPQVAQLQNQAPRGVVMQSVPVDPLAGPVAPKTATHAPRSLQPKAQAGNDAPAKTLAKADAPKPAAEPAKPVSPAENLGAKAEASKNTAPAAKMSLPVKAANVKPNTAQPASKVLPPTPVKAADAKPQADKTAAAKPKDVIPGLRLSANAF